MRSGARALTAVTAAVLVSAAAAGTALANKVFYGGNVNGNKHVIMGFDLVGQNCPFGPHCFANAKVTEFGAYSYKLANCPEVLEGGFEYGNPETLKPTPVKVSQALSFGGRGTADNDQIIRVAFHGHFKSRTKATGWFEVTDHGCTTTKLNWTATLER